MTAILRCIHCGNFYNRGINGTVSGCDTCEGNIRNPIDHTIINDKIILDLAPLMSNDEDPMTDMEKA